MKRKRDIYVRSRGASTGMGAEGSAPAHANIQSVLWILLWLGRQVLTTEQLLRLNKRHSGQTSQCRIWVNHVTLSLASNVTGRWQAPRRSEIEQRVLGIGDRRVEAQPCGHGRLLLLPPDLHLWRVAG